MQSLFILWITWNPDPVAFVLPIFDIPVLWYGIFFVTGFVIGYFIMQKLVGRHISKTDTLYVRDIENPSKLVEIISKKETTDPTFLKKIKTHLLQTVYKKLSSKEPLSEDEQVELLDAISQVNSTSKNKLTRDKLTQAYPGAIKPIASVSSLFVDKLTWFVIIAAIVGARLGYVIFYDIYYYMDHPFEILNTRQGGLASHGGTIGILISLWLFNKTVLKKHPDISILNLLDMLVIPTALAAAFIRLGNFINQEIVGTPTEVPWAVIFGNPANQGPIIPRHPVQLYEMIAYLATFFLLLGMYRYKSLPKGKLTGLFFICIFGSRFILEFFKTHQNSVLTDGLIQAGQWLSIPFIIIGIFLYFPQFKKRIFKLSL